MLKLKLNQLVLSFLVGNKIIIDYTTIVESLGNVKYIPYIYNLLNGQDNISDIRITEKVDWFLQHLEVTHNITKKKIFVIKSR
jgi:exosortase/archaeosortase